jgi:two-component sensor histidine kinase/Tfp pilus assembly protein PilF
VNQGRVLLLLSLCCAFLSARATASTIDSLKHVLQETSDEEQQVKLCLEIAAKFRLSIPDSGHVYTKRAMVLAEKIDSKSGIVEAHIETAMIHMKNAHYTEGIESGLIGAKLAKDYELKHQQADAHLTLGHLYTRIEDFQKARSYFNKALPTFIAEDGKKDQAYCLSGIGNTYFYNNELKDALEYYQLAYRLVEKNGKSRLKAMMLNNMASVHRQQGALEKAEKSYQEAYEIFIERGEMLNVSTIYYNLGQIAYERKDFDKAVINYKKCLQVGIDLNAQEDMKFAYLELARTYDAKREFETAMGYIIKHYQLKDSLSNADHKKRVAELEVKYETAQTVQELEETGKALEKSEQANVKKDSKISDTETQITALWVGVTGLIIITLLILYGYRKQKSLNLQLKAKRKENEEKKAVIQKALGEKEVLLKEVHHRTKNNLQIISSLLRLQSSSVEDKAALNVLDVCQDRIQAIALIHQNLYQSKDLGKVDLGSYIRSLANQQKIAFSNRDYDITVNIETNNVQLNLDTSVPLGLIVNELLTNAYKYAFVDSGKGEITVQAKGLEKDRYELHISDNGAGLPTDFDIKNAESLGFEIVKSLTEQLSGNIKHRSENGAHFDLEFSEQLK